MRSGRRGDGHLSGVPVPIGREPRLRECHRGGAFRRVDARLRGGCPQNKRVEQMVRRYCGMLGGEGRVRRTTAHAPSLGGRGECQVPANLFIDTNILLSFYHFTSDDLAQLRKLAAAVQKRDILLLVPDQVVDEFRRNRDAKIADALKGLRAQKLAFQYPQMCKDYSEYGELRELQGDYEQKHARLVERVLEDASHENLNADDIVQQLFSLGQSIRTTPEILADARTRIELGNPPGKSGSLGDAVNWEALLEGAPSGQTLHFVTEDRDYWSALDSGAFSSFLIDEWTDTKECALKPYKRLSDFLSEDFPEIRLADESEKDALIEGFAGSPNFGTTHMLVAQLRRLGGFTVSQANAILAASVGNNQVGWIAEDPDVCELLRGVIAGRREQLDEELVKAVEELIGPEPDLPF